MSTIYDVACKIFPFRLTVLLAEERGRGVVRGAVEGIKEGRRGADFSFGEK